METDSTKQKLNFLFRIKKFLSHDCSPFEQFLKYVFVGGAATSINIVCSLLLSATIFPCLGPDDWVVKLFNITPAVDISASQRAFLADISAICGFTVSNLFCWIADRIFVFKGGRHRWYLELLYFFITSSIAFAVGLLLQDFLVRFLNCMTSLAYFAQIITAVLINFIARKFFVFKG